MEEPKIRKSYTFNFSDPDELTALHARWRATFPEHGKSFNKWVTDHLARLAEAQI